MALMMLGLFAMRGLRATADPPSSGAADGSPQRPARAAEHTITKAAHRLDPRSSNSPYSGCDRRPGPSMTRYASFSTPEYGRSKIDETRFLPHRRPGRRSCAHRVRRE
jgi:hypothetical protein